MNTLEPLSLDELMEQSFNLATSGRLAEASALLLLRYNEFHSDPRFLRLLAGTEMRLELFGIALRNTKNSYYLEKNPSERLDTLKQACQIALFSKRFLTLIVLLKKLKSENGGSLDDIHLQMQGLCALETRSITLFLRTLLQLYATGKINPSGFNIRMQWNIASMIIRMLSLGESAHRTQKAKLYFAEGWTRKAMAKLSVMSPTEIDKAGLSASYAEALCNARQIDEALDFLAGIEDLELATDVKLMIVTTLANDSNREQLKVLVHGGILESHFSWNKEKLAHCMEIFLSENLQSCALTALHAASLAMENNHVVKYWDARFRYGDNDLHSCIASLYKFLSMSPNDVDGLNLLASAMAALENPAGAISHYEKALKVNEYRYDVRRNLATVLSDVDRLEDAAEHLSILLQRNPNDTTILFKQGNIADKLGNSEAASDLRSRALQLGGNDHELLCEYADHLVDIGEYEKAIEVLEKVNRSDDATETSFFVLGELYIQEEEYELAFSCFNESVQKKVFHPVQFLRVIQLCLLIGELHGAASMIEVGREFFEDAPEINFADALHAHLVGQHDHAKFMYCKTLQANFDKFVCLGNIGAIHFQEQNLVEARACISMAINENELSAESHFALGLVDFFDFQYENAAESFHTAGRLEPMLSKATLMKSLCYFLLTEYELAKVLMDDLPDQDGDAWLGIAALKALLEGQASRAIGILEKDRSEGHLHALSLLIRAAAERVLGRIEEAEKSLNDASKTTPSMIQHKDWIAHGNFLGLWNASRMTSERQVVSIHMHSQSTPNKGR